MGTVLERLGFGCDPPLWSAKATIEHPDAVARLHREYVEAGAEVLTANTFRTQARSLAAAGRTERAVDLTRRAVEAARKAADASRAPEAPRVWVAGSLAPLEDCYLPERAPEDASLEREHAAHAEALCEAGCDLILAETHNTIREACAATRAARATGLPVWSTLVCGEGARLLSGEPLEAALEAIADAGADAVGVNCLAIPHCEETVPVLRRCGVRFGVYPNLHCDPSRPQQAERAIAPEEFVIHARRWLAAGAAFIGACCGSEPRHIRALRDTISTAA